MERFWRTPGEYGIHLSNVRVILRGYGSMAQSGTEESLGLASARVDRYRARTIISHTAPT